ncbi:hypothetical protein EJB05_35606, partial [Eragrostis curvula]
MELSSLLPLLPFLIVGFIHLRTARVNGHNATWERAVSDMVKSIRNAASSGDVVDVSKGTLPLCERGDLPGRVGKGVPRRRWC